MQKRPNEFELLLFSTDTSFIRSAEQAGIHGFIVDWETKDKADRQKGYDTQINKDTLHDLEKVRQVTGQRVICRVNAFGEWTQDEVQSAVQAGADEIFLPMVRTPEQVQRALDYIKGNCDLSILVETVDAIDNARELAKLPLKRVYAGLNDLSIERKISNIFVSLIDGTMDSIHSLFDCPFGFAGLTSPELGHPIPCRLLIADMARLQCDFTFLRRSFTRDMAGKDMTVEVPRILDALSIARTRTQQEVQQDKDELTQMVRKWTQAVHTG